MNEFLCTKFISDGMTDIIRQVQFAQKAFQFEQFGIRTIIKPRFNGNSIINLIAKGVGRVVHQYSLTEVSAQDVQVFEEVAFDGKTAFAVEAMVNVLAICT